MRVGFSQDSHKFTADSNKKLILGGVVIPGEPGLESNSDGDAVIHALCGAIEQALGNDPFSIYADALCRQGITDSREYLKMAIAHLKEKECAIGNIGISIEAKRPKIIPWINAIKKSLSSTLEISSDKIGVNATSGEGMTSFGKGEGIQVFVIVSLTP